jgi:hypothetical protein
MTSGPCDGGIPYQITCGVPSANRSAARRSFRKLAGLLSVTFLLHAPATPLAAQQITTFGDCSPVIAGVAGGVKANINCYKTLLAPAPISLWSIETVLNKGSTFSAAQFFRPEGLLWIDFVNGFHPFLEADLAWIKAKIDNASAAIVIGQSAKWRENFTRFVGWSLARDGNKVLYTDASRWPGIPVFDLPVLSELKEPAVLIIENAHWRSDQIDELLLTARTKSPALRVIISASPSFLFDPLQLPGPGTMALSADALHLDGRAIAERLVEVYAQKVLRIQPDKQIVNALLDVCTRYSLFGASSFFDPGPEFDVDPLASGRGRNRDGPSLWTLASVLSSWDGRSVPDESLNPRTDRAGSALPLFARLSTEAISCLYAIATLSFFNTPAPNPLLTDALKYDARVMESLLQREMIDRTEYGFVIRDTGIIPAVLQRLVSGGELEFDLLRRVQGPNVSLGLLTRAMEFGVPAYDTMLLNYTAYYFVNAYRRPSLTVPLREVPDNLIAAAERALLADERPGNFGRALIGFSRLPGAVPTHLKAKVASMIPSLDAPTITGKDIAWFLMGLQASDPLSADRVARQINTDRIVHLLQIEPKFERVGSILWALQRINPGKATEVLRRLDVAQLLNTHNSTMLQPAALGWVLEVSSGIDKAVAARLADLADIDFVHLQRTISANPAQLSGFAFGLSSADPARAAAMFDRLGSDFLVSTLRATTYDVDFATTLRALALSNPNLARSVSSLLGDDAIARRIRSSRSNEAAGLLWVAVREVDAELAARLRTSVSTNLSAEEALAARQVQMFSTRDPSAMAMAQEHQDWINGRMRALQVYQIAYESNLEVEPVEISKLIDAYEINPERVFEMLRSTSWRRLIEIYGDAETPSLQFGFARLLYTVRPDKFEEWLATADNSPGRTVFDSKFLSAMMTAGRPPGEIAWARSVRMLNSDALKGLRITKAGYDAHELTGFVRFMITYDRTLAKRFAGLLTNQSIKAGLAPPKLETLSGLVVAIREAMAGNIGNVKFLIGGCPQFQIALVAGNLSRTKAVLDCLIDKYGDQARHQLASSSEGIELFELVDLVRGVRQSGRRDEVQGVVGLIFSDNPRICARVLEKIDGATLFRNIDPTDPLSFDDAPEYLGAIYEARSDLRRDLRRRVLAWAKTGSTQNWKDRFFLIWRTSWTSRDFATDVFKEMTTSELTDSIVADEARRLGENLSHLITLGGPSTDTFLKKVDWDRIRSILLGQLFEPGGFTLLAEVVENVAPSDPTYLQPILDGIHVQRLRTSLLASLSGVQERRYSAKLILALATHAPRISEEIFDESFASQVLLGQNPTPDSVEELSEVIAALHIHNTSLWRRVMMKVVSPALIEYFRRATTHTSDDSIDNYRLGAGITGLLTEVSLFNPAWLRSNEDAIRQSMGKLAKSLDRIEDGESYR